MMRRYGKYIVIYLVAGVLGSLLLYTSQRVRDARDDVRALNREITREREEISVLRAEWAFLNNPQRLERLAAEHLDLIAPVPGQMTDGLEVFVGMIPVFSHTILPRMKPVYLRGSLYVKPMPRPELQSVEQIKAAVPKKPIHSMPSSFDSLMRRLDREEGKVR